MILTFRPAFLVLNFAALFFLTDADNTPNLCTDDIPNLTKIKPSETASHPIPNITVGGFEYNGDAEHFVIRPPLGSGETYSRVLVYIPGTTDRPELSSCLIKSAANTLDKKIRPKIPILALSYQYLSSGDKFRNGKCALLPTEAEQVECLLEQHEDAINGGDYGATHFKDDGSAFWGEVLPENALRSRLGDLLVYLNSMYPDEGWSEFISFKGFPKWKKMIVSGHSQGAGHAAYLAMKFKTRGTIMISGPQDECIDCTDGFWIDEGPYKSLGSYTALAHGNEPMVGVMRDNWIRMKAAEPAINWATGEESNVGFGLGIETSDACAGPLITDVAHALNSTCGGKDHCSTAIDDSVPFIETFQGDKYYVYEESVWPAILIGGTSKTEC